MVQYKCETCQRIFTKKYNYDKHLERKIPCTIMSNLDKKQKIYKCKCGKKFNRKDNLNRHRNKCQKYKNISINNSGNIYGDQIINNGKMIINNNNNYYILFPFSQEIDKLTTEDKICIFSSDENPIIMIVIKTNLNPNNPEYHNEKLLCKAQNFTFLKSEYEQSSYSFFSMWDIQTNI